MPPRNSNGAVLLLEKDPVEETEIGPTNNFKPALADTENVPETNVEPVLVNAAELDKVKTTEAGMVKFAMLMTPVPLTV